jgi:hypothetical protein
MQYIWAPGPVPNPWSSVVFIGLTRSRRHYLQTEVSCFICCNTSQQFEERKYEEIITENTLWLSLCLLSHDQCHAHEDFSCFLSFTLKHTL